MSVRHHTDAAIQRLREAQSERERDEHAHSCMGHTKLSHLHLLRLSAPGHTASHARIQIFPVEVRKKLPRLAREVDEIAEHWPRIMAWLATPADVRLGPCLTHSNLMSDNAFYWPAETCTRVCEQGAAAISELPELEAGLFDWGSVAVVRNMSLPNATCIYAHEHRHGHGTRIRRAQQAHFHRVSSCPERK